MTIYRGAGGGGNATSDSEINALTALTAEAGGYASEASASASAASTSASAASASASAASTSESNASTSAASAVTSASAASTSATNAATSETNAASSASAAAASASSLDASNIVYKTGDQTLAGVKTFSSTIVGSVSGSAALNALKGANTDITSLGSLASINGGQLAGFRNKIINGNFPVNNRAVSGSVVLAAGAYGHNMWKAGASGCSYTFATSNNVTTLTITAGSLQQVIEGNRLFSGTHVLSWGGTAQGRIDGGSYGATGITGTATGGTNLTVEFNTGTLSLVQFEQGSVPTYFEDRTVGMEILLCQRYLPSFNGTLAGTEDVGWGGTTSTSAALIGFVYPVEPRVRPTGVVVSSAAHFSLTTMAASSAATAITFSTGSKRMCRLSVTGTATPYTANQPAILYGTSASAIIIFTGAEL